MGKTKIDWKNPAEGWELDETHNIITGCLQGCPYCYAKKMAMRFPERFGKDFKPTFHKDKLGYFASVKKSKTFFVGSMADMFGEWVPEEWIEAVLADCAKAPQHRYMFLTKNPKRYAEFEFTTNMWLGMTMTHGGDSLGQRTIWDARKAGLKTFLSAEPLLGTFRAAHLQPMFDLVIVGAMSGPNAVKVEDEWVKTIIHPNIYFKNSMKGII